MDAGLPVLTCPVVEGRELVLIVKQMAAWVPMLCFLLLVWLTPFGGIKGVPLSSSTVSGQ